MTGGRNSTSSNTAATSVAAIGRKLFTDYAFQFLDLGVHSGWWCRGDGPTREESQELTWLPLNVTT